MEAFRPTQRPEPSIQKWTKQVFLKKTAQVCERDEKMSLRKLAILANVDDAFTSDSHKSLKGLADGHQRFHLRHPAIINSSN